MTQAEPITAGAPYDELRARTTGTVAVAGDADYAALVTPWNLAIEVRPDAVLAARTAQDVVEAVRFAGRHGLVVTPQATGHGAISAFVGELLVNTAGLDECVVHPEGWARVGAGVKWLRVVEAAAPYGLAPLSGSITDVGIVGYITGGGLGPMARTYGLASDRVRAIEVVTGDGELRRATPTEHADLFFGLRGGKGALGIVTAIEFDLVQQPTLLRRRAVVRRRARRDGDRAVARPGAPTCRRRQPRRSRCSNCRTCPACRRSWRAGSRCRCATSGPATPTEGARSARADARSRADADRRRGRQALHRHRFGAHRSAGSGAGQRGGRRAHRLPGGRPLRRCSRVAGPDRTHRRSWSRSGRWAAPPRGPASTTARSARARPRTRVLVVGYRGRARGPGPRPVGAGGARALDRRTSAAELHLPTPTELPSAYDDWTRARLRHAIRAYDPEGVIAIGHALV